MVESEISGVEESMNLCISSHILLKVCQILKGILTLREGVIPRGRGQYIYNIDP